MKRFVVLSIAVFGGIMVWSIGNRLSADAVGMAVGVLFGIIAGLPVALLLLAAGRRRDADADYGRRPGRGMAAMQNGPYPQQPPVIVLAGAPMGNQQMSQMPYGFAQENMGGYSAGALPGPTSQPSGREFRVVGEVDSVIEQY